MLGLTMKLDQQFFTKFTEYYLSPFDIIKISFDFQIDKFNIDGRGYRFDYYRLGFQDI